LPKAGDRACCKQARQLFQTRRRGVFPVPVRACIDARTRGQ
jgi:predicted RNase H-like nuclease